MKSDLIRCELYYAPPQLIKKVNMSQQRIGLLEADALDIRTAQALGLKLREVLNRLSVPTVSRLGAMVDLVIFLTIRVAGEAPGATLWRVSNGLPFLHFVAASELLDVNGWTRRIGKFLFAALVVGRMLRGADPYVLQSRGAREDRAMASFQAMMPRDRIFAYSDLVHGGLRHISTQTMSCIAGQMQRMLRCVGLCIEVEGCHHCGRQDMIVALKYGDDLFCYLCYAIVGGRNSAAAIVRK